jgi:two-component system OmpR family sensor kinase
VAESAADFRAAGSDHPITVVAPHEAPARVDADRVRQIVDNLLENVRVHTDPGTPVSVAVNADGEVVTIEVVDGGPGIHPEDRDRLFDRFWRADPSRARKTGGSGLGLSIVSSIVVAHGGTISVDGSPAGGAAFRVSLPVREDNRA